ncbi:Enoyl reductase TSC13 [Kluyveromyces marxianus]
MTQKQAAKQASRQAAKLASKQNAVAKENSKHLQIKSRSKTLKDVTIDLPADNTLTYDSILTKVSAENGNISVKRLRLTYLKEGKHIVISNAEIKEKDKKRVFDTTTEWYVKDLGPQISWRLVFVIEYLGPILIHSLMFYLSSKPEFRNNYHSTKVLYNEFFNSFVYRLIMLHYLKREFETIFIHTFSNDTMPLFNLFKNSFHYWVLNGLISLGYFGYGFPLDNQTLFKIYNTVHLSDFRVLAGLFAISEALNFYVHLRLRRWGDEMKKNGVTKRIPLETGLFKIFVAPNYTFESYAWIWFTLLFKLNLFSVLFLLVSVVQMYLWAQKKNAKYGTKRAFLIPYVF